MSRPTPKHKVVPLELLDQIHRIMERIAGLSKLEQLAARDLFFASYAEANIGETRAYATYDVPPHCPTLDEAEVYLALGNLIGGIMSGYDGLMTRDQVETYCRTHLMKPEPAPPTSGKRPRK